MGNQHTRSLLTTLRNNRGAQYRLWPDPAVGSGAEGVQVDSGANVYSALEDVIAANAIATEFWLAGLVVYTTDVIQDFHVRLYDATLVAYRADFEFHPTLVTLNVAPMHLPIPIYEAANSQIQAMTGGAAARTLRLHIIYLTGI